MMKRHHYDRLKMKAFRYSFKERKKRVGRLKAQTVTAMIPNIATLMALCCGMTAIRFGLLERWDMAIVAVLVAAILDAVDGRLARLLNSTSRFGAELDSFSDFISFGVTPSIIMYVKGLSQWGELGWAIALFFSVCMCLRLARFNVMSLDETIPSWKMGFSMGVPAPAGGFLALFPLVLFYAFPEIDMFKSIHFYAACMLLSSLLMVSRIPTFTLKKLVIKPRYVLPFLLSFVIAIACLYVYPWIMLSLIGVVYMLLIPLSIICYKKCELKYKDSNELADDTDVCIDGAFGGEAS